jgi:threonine/homoserine/homoserine lactone efflux protein
VSGLLLPLIWFACAAAFTPGPNNIMVAASGANYGFVRTLPHMFGIAFGFTFMIFAVGVGLGQVFKVYPQVHTGLKWAGTAYLLYLAWRIATAGRPRGVDAYSKPLTFLQAALFQWVNPKAWMMGVSALTAFTTASGNYLAETLVVAGTFLAVSFPSISVWCLFGVGIGRFLKSDKALRVFNWTMAGLIVASIALLFGRDL